MMAFKIEHFNKQAIAFFYVIHSHTHTETEYS